MRAPCCVIVLRRDWPNPRIHASRITGSRITFHVSCAPQQPLSPSTLPPSKHRRCSRAEAPCGSRAPGMPRAALKLTQYSCRSEPDQHLIPRAPSGSAWAWLDPRRSDAEPPPASPSESAELLRSSVGAATATDAAAGGRVGISVGADAAWATAPSGTAPDALAALGAGGCGGGVGMGLVVLCRRSRGDGRWQWRCLAV